MDSIIFFSRTLLFFFLSFFLILSIVLFLVTHLCGDVGFLHLHQSTVCLAHLCCWSFDEGALVSD